MHSCDVDPIEIIVLKFKLEVKETRTIYKKLLKSRVDRPGATDFEKKTVMHTCRLSFAILVVL